MSEIHDAYAARKAAETMNDTWGHLRPDETMAYDGYILYTQGEYGDIVCIFSHFDGLRSSPWLYEDIHDFMGDNGEENGKVYLWSGTYCRGRGRAKKFTGQFTRITAGSMLSMVRER